MTNKIDKQRLNAIILDGEMYALVPSLGNAKDCFQCDIREQCQAVENNYTCTIFGVEKGYCFKHLHHMVKGEQIVRGTKLKEAINYQ